MFATQDNVETFLELLGAIGGVLAGSLIVAAFRGDQQDWQGIDCLVPFEAEGNLDPLIEFVFATTGWLPTQESADIFPWSRLVDKTYGFECSSTGDWKLKLSVTKFGLDPREFIANNFDFEFVRNFYSPADDVVRIGCPTSLVQRRTFLDSRFTEHTLNRVKKYRDRGFAIEFEETAAVHAYQQAREQSTVVYDTNLAELDRDLCNDCWPNILSIAHRHTLVTHRKHQRPQPAIALYPNIKVPRCL